MRGVGSGLRVPILPVLRSIHDDDERPELPPAFKTVDGGDMGKDGAVPAGYESCADVCSPGASHSRSRSRNPLSFDLDLTVNASPSKPYVPRRKTSKVAPCSAMSAGPNGRTPEPSDRTSPTPNGALTPEPSRRYVSEARDPSPLRAPPRPIGIVARLRMCFA